MNTRELPDPHLSLRDTSDFIFDSELGRRALIDPLPRNLAILLRDVVALIYRLTVSCQLPEFTEHGLPHICSLIDRICRWTIPIKDRPSIRLVDQLTPTEAGQLLFAVLVHDIGMLSQRPEDLPVGESAWQSRSTRDVPLWVRTTHIPRMPLLIRRAFRETALNSVLIDPVIEEAMAIAQAHGSWPWEKGFTNLAPRAAALAGILAICDLLDEDSNRCDITTLLNHRLGSHLNCAHWIRHGLTKDRVLVVDGTIGVQLVTPTGTTNKMAPVFAALRNHFRLALLYREMLRPISAEAVTVHFNAPTGCPSDLAPELTGWNKVPGFANEPALVYHLLSTFMAIGLVDTKRVSASEISQADNAGLEVVDLTPFYAIRGITEPRSLDEHVFRALTADS